MALERDADIYDPENGGLQGGSVLDTDWAPETVGQIIGTDNEETRGGLRLVHEGDELA